MHGKAITDEHIKRFQSAGIEAAKEWHGSEEGRKWHSEHGKNNWEKRNKNKVAKKCTVCGNEYETAFPLRSKYCGDNCKMKRLRKRFNEQGRDYTYGHRDKCKNQVN